MNVDDLINELQDLCEDLKPGQMSNQKPKSSNSIPSSQSGSAYSQISSSKQSSNQNNNYYQQPTSSPWAQKDNFDIPDSYVQQKTSNNATTTSTQGITGKGEIDDLLHILSQEDYSLSSKDKAPSMKPTENAASSLKNSTGGIQKQTKCLNPYLCNGHELYVLDEYNMKKRICNELRCSLCNIKITKMENYKWTNEADLMHFRNNFSRKDKLLSETISDKNYSAYSCQCKGVSVNKLGTAADYGMKEWRCMGHYD